MVALPKKLKYKQEIFEAVIDVFSKGKDDEIYYREIWRRVKKVLGKQISFRDFEIHVKYMESEKLLKRRDPGGRGPKVHFSLTDKARRMNAFKILGIDESFKNRKKIYQLLLLFKLIKRSNPVTQLQLNRFLNKIGSSKATLEIAKIKHNITHFKPIKGVEIIKWIQHDPNASVYHITIPGFTINEFISYLVKLKKDKEPRPFPYDASITNVHFIVDVNLSRPEVIDAIKSLIDDGLIKLVNAVFPGEMRYDITDECLIKFLKDVWMIHDMDLRLLFERIFSCDEIKDEDKNILKLMYGKKIADRILAIEYNKRKMIKDQRLKNEEKASRKFINIQAKHRMSLVQNILKRHQKVIEKYEILSELIDDICFPSLSNKT